MSDLNAAMEFDHVIRVMPDGTIDDHPTPHVYAPESIITTDDDGQISAEDERTWIESIERQGWGLMSGYTGQYGYAGPIMHASEYIGGAMEDDILSEPGLYVVISVECLPLEEDGESDTAGWAVAYRRDSDQD